MIIYNKEEYENLQQKLRDLLANESIDSLEKQKIMSDILSKMKDCTDIDLYNKILSKQYECIEYTINKIVELEIKNLKQSAENNNEKTNKINKEDVIEEFTYHFCYYFSKMLYDLFPDEATIYLDNPGGHSIVKFNSSFYDIRGRINNIIDLENFKKLDNGTDDIEFLQHSDLCKLGREKISEKKEKDFDKIVDIIKIDEIFLNLRKEYFELKEQYDVEKNLN